MLRQQPGCLGAIVTSLSKCHISIRPVLRATLQRQELIESHPHRVCTQNTSTIKNIKSCIPL